MKLTLAHFRTLPLIKMADCIKSQCHSFEHGEGSFQRSAFGEFLHNLMGCDLLRSLPRRLKLATLKFRTTLFCWAGVDALGLYLCLCGSHLPADALLSSAMRVYL